ncbi:MAG: hypothetical protein ABMA15_15785 [Vicinamibacterales bacterium]
MRSSILSLIGSIALTASAFLPWLRLGDVGLPGIPDPAGFFVLALGIVSLLLSGVGAFTRRDVRPWFVLLGLAGLTTLAVVWRTGPATIADRALSRAEAVSIVDGVPIQPVPPVRVGSGLLVGLVGAMMIAAAGVSGPRTNDRT